MNLKLIIFKDNPNNNHNMNNNNHNNDLSGNYFVHGSILSSAHNSIKNSNYPVVNPSIPQFSLNEYQQPNPIASQNGFQLKSLHEARAMYHANNNKLQTNIQNFNAIRDPEIFRKNRMVK